MYETVSLFDNMELDNTQQRVASRRALALSHKRVEDNLGSFLRGARSEAEFFERLALIQDDFAGYVATASAEVDHEHPEHIAASLVDYYRQAAERVEFAETPEEEEEDEKKEAKVRWATVKPLGDKQSAPLAQPNQDPNDPAWQAVQDQYGQSKPWNRPNDGVMMHDEQQGMGQRYPATNVQGQQYPESYQGPEIQAPQGEIMAPNLTMPPMDEQQLQQLGPRRQGANDPSEQRDNSGDKVTCPECGGSGKTANAGECPKCKGAGKVGNFGGSVLDALDHSSKTAEAEGNTGLGKPEPKMDKGQWDREHPGEPKVDDGNRWPTERKDVIEPIGPANNEHELKEIGEKATETVDLPTDSSDKPFADNNMPAGPHTKTFNGDGQADPVTNTALSSTNNPIGAMLKSKWPSVTAVRQAFIR